MWAESAILETPGSLAALSTGCPPADCLWGQILTPFGGLGGAVDIPSEGVGGRDRGGVESRANLTVGDWTATTAMPFGWPVHPYAQADDSATLSLRYRGLLRNAVRIADVVTGPKILKRLAKPGQERNNSASNCTRLLHTKFRLLPGPCVSAID